MNSAIERIEETEETSVGSILDSIETNLWLSEAYFLRGAEALAVECLRSGWEEYLRFAEVLRVYSGGDSLRDTLLQRLAAMPGAESLSTEVPEAPGEKLPIAA